MILSDSSP